MVDSFKNNFFLLPALFLAALLYGGLFPLEKTSSYSSLISEKNVRVVKGRLVSSPTAFGGATKFRKCRLRLEAVWDGRGGASKAEGLADILLPVELCDIYQPGKLYSAWRGKKIDFLLEQGALVELAAVPCNRKKAGPCFECKEILSSSFGRGFFARLMETRALCRLHFTRLMFAWGKAGGLLLALLSGSRAYLSQDAQEAFKKAGLSHVLALSGMHLSLIGGLAFAIGKKSFGKRLAFALQFFSILAFVWFAGKSPSLFRALLCSLAALLSSVLKVRFKSALNPLALVFIVHICIFPKDALELSFMLSYGALFGILAFNEIMSKSFSSLFPEGMGSSLGASAGAQLFTMPISLKTFGLFAPAGIISSAAISPFVALFVDAGLFFVLISLGFPFLAPFCGTLLKIFYEALSRGVFFFAAFPCLKI